MPTVKRKQFRVEPAVRGINGAVEVVPFVECDRGIPFLPFIDYIIERRQYKHLSIGTLNDEAYIICGWLNYLNLENRHWKSGSDSLIDSYKSCLLDKRLSKRRVQRIIDVIFSFYFICQSRLGRVSRIVEDPRLAPSSGTHPITSDLSKRGGLISSIRFATLPEGPGRPTPNSAQVEDILDALLEHGNEERAMCFWLLASLMYRAGLREQGAANFKISAFADALIAEGILKPNQRMSLVSFGSDPQQQSTLLRNMSDLEAAGRDNIYALVTEKGEKSRLAPIPIDLAQNILLYIWHYRRSISSNRSSMASDFVFISMKSGTCLNPKSIGNIIKTVFNKLGINGSAHRLRAAFAHQIIKRAYLRAKAAHGRNWDIGAVLLEAKESLGHRRDRSLRSYLNRVIVEVELAEGHPVIVNTRQHYREASAAIDLINSGDIIFLEQLRGLINDRRSSMPS